MADTDVLVSELTQASAINTTDLLLMTQPDAQAETGYTSRKANVLQVANKLLKDTEYTTDLPHFTDKTVLGGLEELSTGKANTSGEYNGLISGQANALKPSARLENSTPYLFRPSYSNGYGYETLIGGTCGVNQLVQIPTNIISVTTTNTSIKEIQNNIPFVANHKYLVSYRQSATLTSNTRNTLCYVANGRKYQGASENRNLASGFYYWLFNCSDTVNDGTLEIWCNSPSNNVDFDLFNLIDLTAMFGTTIADYVYNLENG